MFFSCLTDEKMISAFDPHGPQWDAFLGFFFPDCFGYSVSVYTLISEGSITHLNIASVITPSLLPLSL